MAVALRHEGHGRTAPTSQFRDHGQGDASLQQSRDPCVSGVVEPDCDLRVRRAAVSRDWRDAAKVGAERGRHEPATDALLHLGVVEPVAAGGPTVQIAIGCVPPGIPAPEADVRSTLTPPPKPSSEGD